MQTKVVLFLCLAGAAWAQSVTSYTSLSAYSSATTSTTLIGFSGILPANTPYQSFNPLSVQGVAFTTPTFMNVNTADYYSPSDYPADYLLSTGQTGGSDTLVIALPTPTLALALDYGQLFGGNPATITLSNGYMYTAASPTVGTTAFVGFVSTTPITSVTYTVGGSGYFVLEDLRISTPAPVSGSTPPTVTMSFSNPIVPAGSSTQLIWSSSNASSCTAYGSWTGAQATAGQIPVQAPSTPGYYTYSLVCSGAGGPTLQSAVLTAAGATPSPSNTFTLATLELPPPNQITALQMTLTVPPKPPVPSYVEASLFVWPGLEPISSGANYLPINNGVLQPVLSWGPSCAPTSQPTPFTSWWISGQYVNTFGSDPGYEGCYSGSSLLVAPGDQLAIGMSLDQSSNIWTENITDSTTNQTVGFTMNMMGQSQNYLIFAIESYYGSAILTPATFSNTTITFQSTDWNGTCLPSQGASNNYVFTPPISQNSGTQCFIQQIQLTQKPPAAQLSVSSSHAGSFGQAQDGATYTITVSNASGVGETIGSVMVTENVPSGMTLVSLSGTGWTCSSNTCGRSDALSSGFSYPPITATVNVALNAGSPEVNQVSVAGGGSAMASFNDSTTVTPSACDVTPTATSSLAQVQTMLNEGLGTASPVNDLNSSGTVTVVDIQIVANAAAGRGCSE